MSDEREQAIEAATLYRSIPRDLAVEVVDAIHGYTCEFSENPAAHRAEYDIAEDAIAGRWPSVLQAQSAELDAARELVGWFDELTTRKPNDPTMRAALDRIRSTLPPSTYSKPADEVRFT